MDGKGGIRKVVLLIATWVVVACWQAAGGASASYPEEDVRRYFPAGRGAVWEYQGIGNEFAKIRIQVLAASGDRVQIAESNGGTRLGQVYRLAADEVVLVYSREEFYGEQQLLREPANRERLILRAPLLLGQSWATDRERREVVGVRQTLQVPAGSYHDVVKIKVTAIASPGGWTFEYYAPEVGLVMREFLTSGHMVVSKLKSYHAGE